MKYFRRHASLRTLRQPSVIMSRANFDKYVVGSHMLGRKNANEFDGSGEQFVFESVELLGVIRNYGGNLPRHVEQLLGLNMGSLGDKPVIGFVNSLSADGWRLPKESDEGANAQFVSGGKTSGGVTEAVINALSESCIIYMPSDQEGIIEEVSYRFCDLDNFNKSSWLAKLFMQDLRSSNV